MIRLPKAPARPALDRLRRLLVATLLCTAAAGSALLLGCPEDGQTGTHIGNPSGSAGLALTVTSDQTDPSGLPTFADSTGIGYTLTHARTYVRDIRLDLPSGTTCDAIAADLEGAICLLDDGGFFQIRVQGPFAIDLITQQATPDLAAVRLPAIRFHRIDFRIDDGDPDDGVISAGDELVDLSLVAQADFSYMGTPLVLDLHLRFNEDVRIEAAGGVAVPSDGTLLALLDVGRWLAGVPIGTCLDEGGLEVVDGRVLIDEDAGDDDCDDLDDAVKVNVRGSGSLSAED